MVQFIGRFVFAGFKRKRRGESVTGVVHVSDVISDGVIVDGYCTIPRPHPGFSDKGHVFRNEWFSWEAPSINGYPTQFKEVGMETPPAIQKILDEYEAKQEKPENVIDQFLQGYKPTQYVEKEPDYEPQHQDDFLRDYFCKPKIIYNPLEK